MTHDDRREFLKRLSAIGTATLAACGGGGAGALPGDMPVAAAPTPSPAPPAAPPGPALAPDPGSIPAPAAGLPQFSLYGGTGESTLLPFCLGQAFKQGEIGKDAEITCGLATFQATVLNRWPDGTPKFAVLAGRAGVAAGATRTFRLSGGSGSAGRAAVSEAQLKQSGVTAKLEFAPYGAVELQSLIGVASTYDSARKRWSAGRVRQGIAGPEMSSWTYYAPVADHPHLAAWFEVRYWASGQIQVLPWIENGYLNVAGPTSFEGQLVFTLNGAQRFSGAVTLANHCRTAALGTSASAHWAGAAGGLQYGHDTAYLQQTGLVPTYASRLGSASAVLARQKTSFTPLMQADFPPGMGAGGFHPSIGLLPEWDVAYLVSNADARAQMAVSVHGFAAGRYGIHYRDETTNQPPRFSSYPDLCLAGGSSLGISGSGTSSANSYTPATSGVAPAAWISSHHPSVGYLAYLVTGWFYFAEEVQFSATLHYLKQTNVTRGRSKGLLLPDAGANTTRGAAWALRTLAQAITVTPDAQEPLRTELVNSMASNVEDYHQKYVAQTNNPHGVCKPYSDYSAGDNKYLHAMWMEDFLTAAWGYTLSLRMPFSDAVRGKLEAFFQWKAQSIVGRFGEPGVATQYNFTDAAQYTMAVAPSDTADFATGKGPWYSDWGAIYAATTGQSNQTQTNEVLRGAYFPDTTSYWGNLQPALAYAVTHGAVGATKAYQRMTGAKNWAQFVAGLDSQPVWGVRPAIGL
jgi:hypothetical protein